MYGDSLNEMIRDRLVFGVNHDTIQPRLLAEKELTFERTFEIAQSIEAAEKNCKIIKNGSNGKQETLHYSETGFTHKDRNSDKEFRENPTGYQCGGPHLAPSCRFKETICRFCKKRGMLRRCTSPRLTPNNLYQHQKETFMYRRSKLFNWKMLKHMASIL